VNAKGFYLLLYSSALRTLSLSALNMNERVTTNVCLNILIMNENYIHNETHKEANVKLT